MEDTTNKDMEKIENGPESKDFVVIREEIKSRPINKGKLARKTLVAAISAVVFGIVACVTFFVLAPFVSGFLAKTQPQQVEEEQPEVTITPIVFPEDTIEEEVNPEDMLITTPEEPPIDINEIAKLEEEEIQEIIDNIEFTLDDYEGIYAKLTDIAKTAQRSLVKVETVTTDTDWFSNMYEDTSEISGLIIGENEVNLFVLTLSSVIKSDADIYIMFANDVAKKAEVWSVDKNTGICILTIPQTDITDTMREFYTIATLGSSSVSKLNGNIILAIGSPMGIYESINYGMVTASGTKLNVVDNSYKLITTDIYGSPLASGVLINLRGEVIGVINPKYFSNDTRNLISAVGISEMKKNIEMMINKQELIYFGITGSSLPDDPEIKQFIPHGTFVQTVTMDSPAMVAGIQAGDIITRMNHITINGYTDTVNVIRDLVPQEEIEVAVQRKGPDGYKELIFTVIPEVLQ